jgi:hypothetical protein
MRLWLLHLHYPDSKGLVALQRTRGCQHHPQLIRFCICADSLDTQSM